MRAPPAQLRLRGGLALVLAQVSLSACNFGPHCVATASSTCVSSAAELSLPYLQYLAGSPVRPVGPDGGNTGPGFENADFGSLVDVLRTREEFRAGLELVGVEEANVQTVDFEASKVVVAWEKTGGGWGGIYLQGLLVQSAAATVEYAEIQYCGDASDVSSSYYAHFFVVEAGVSVNACGSYWDCEQDSGVSTEECPSPPAFERLIPL